MILSVAMNLTLRNSCIEIFQVIDNWQLWKATFDFRGYCVYGRNDWLGVQTGKGKVLKCLRTTFSFSFCLHRPVRCTCTCLLSEKSIRESALDKGICFLIGGTSLRTDSCWWDRGWDEWQRYRLLLLGISYHVFSFSFHCHVQDVTGGQVKNKVPIF